MLAGVTHTHVHTHTHTHTHTHVRNWRSIQPNLDCNYPVPKDLAPIGIRIGAKSIVI